MNYYLDVLKKYAVFGGRARRKEYWMFVPPALLAMFVGFWGGLLATYHFFPDPALFSEGGNSLTPTPDRILIGLILLYELAVLVPIISVSVRRLHDIGRSGWWFLINLIPPFGEIGFLILAVIDSQPGDNQYGPNPKGVTAAVS